MNGAVRAIVRISLLAVLAIALIVSLVSFASASNLDADRTRSNVAEGEATPSATPTPSNTPTATPTPTPATCPVEYQQETPSQDTAKVLKDFTARYEKEVLGSSDPYGTAVQTFLVNTAGKYALALVAWGHLRGVLLDTNSAATLVKDGCLSDEGRDVLNQLKGSLASAASFKEVPNAPADAINSGIYDGVYGVDAIAGLRGDLRAIEITNADGSKTYILIRCGNPVYPAPPAGVPNVPTDNPAPEPEHTPEQPGKPRPSPEPTCEPPSTGTPPNCKGPATGDPASNGRADDGGGLNDNPTRGEETIVPVHPGPAPQVIPVEPEPTVAPSTPEEPAPTPAPEPEPEPEPEAPSTEAPVVVCVPIPGVEDCT